MNTLNKDLLEIRKRIVKAMKSELLGPGSEVSYPDEEHELISEVPFERYSVGILYPKDDKFGDNDEVSEAVSREDTEDENFDEESDAEKETEIISSTGSMYKDDSCDEEVNLAQQNKPSSVGLTFFVSGDIKSMYVSVDYAIYNLAADNEIEVPYFGDTLNIPDCLSTYISFDEKSQTIKKLRSINYRDLSDLFEHNAIENPELFTATANLNKIFKTRKSYRRFPYKEKLKLDFDGNKSKCELKNTGGYVTAVKRKITEKIYGITVMLVNEDRDGKKKHIFQPVISIQSGDLFGEIFLDYNKIAKEDNLDEEEKSLALLYSKKEIYGTGHGVSVDWNIEQGIREIHTEFMPIYEVPKINLNLRRGTESEKSIDEKCLSMKYLSDLESDDKIEKTKNLSTFINTYGEWIKNLRTEIENNAGYKRYEETAKKHISRCLESYQRMVDGIELLKKDETAYRAFNLANRAMFMQRIHGTFQKEDKYPDDVEWQEKMSRIDYFKESDENARWRPFQLAFLLMSINGIVNPSSRDRDFVDLIWFPTGGGKTEAYLGVTAFTIFYRRLKNPANGGTTVMMRYTLRLLTSQQFVRASTLICACEKIREDEKESGYKNYNLGNEKITIGLWIGGEHTPNTNAKAKESFDKLKSGSNLKISKDKYNKFQVLKCPWCGTKIVQDEINRKIKGTWGYAFKNKHFYLHCTQEGCVFEKSLPIQVVDEELYANPPTLLFGTVDKFAMMAWKKDIRSFFGVNGNDAPDLIIQDELHLIAGPLGSMVGLYETAIDYLCSYKGKRPKIIASTATIRQADLQCRALYNREVRQFPAQGLDAADSFFAKEIPTDEDFGRLYLGVMPSGKTKVMLQARATAAALQFVWQLDCPDEEKDKFYTLAVYFNSLKELGKASSVVADDVKDFIKRITYRQIVKRYSSRNIGMAYELTSRVSTTELNDTLDKLEHLTFSEDNMKNQKYPINVLLASNMISVGVDVARLNLMMLQGQPKSVSEYIQASSRIGRSYPGLAVTLYDASKSRDRSFYEQFKAFHSAFYKFVEPTGVTPFSAPSRDRALHAVLLSAVRQSVSELNSDKDACMACDEYQTEKIKKIAKYISDRIKEINSFNPKGMKDDSEDAEGEITEFINEWISKAEKDEHLTYGDDFIVKDAPKGADRLIKRFDDKSKDDAQKTLTSLRNVDKTVPVSVVVWEGEYD